MISTENVTLSYGKRKLFEDVSIRFTPGNCYGLIGANGSGKSTFLKILSGDVEPSHGTVTTGPGDRIAALKQDHFEFDELPVLHTVMVGHKNLYDIMTQKDAIYAKPDFNNKDGLEAAHLEAEFAELDGWMAETQAAKLLSDLGVKEHLHALKMKELSGGEKVRVLLAQALFGNPDILLMDEPTNNLDVETIIWLENFLYEFQNTVIVVSHDRHFLDKVCTHMADIDFNRITVFAGNYSFWKEASELVLKQKSDQNRKTEAKIEDLKSFVARFSANASKAKQASSRKNLLDKLTLEDIKPSSRRYPHIHFKQKRAAGNNLLNITSLAKSIENKPMFKEMTFTIDAGEKVAFVGKNRFAVTTLFQTLVGEEKPDYGRYEWGVTTTNAYFPKENEEYFAADVNLIDWLRQFSEEQDETFIRGFLGKMLFSGEESQKKATVLSGGEKVRCLLAKMMVSEANVLILDEPTNHLDLESISALNKGLIDFKGTVLFTSHDHLFVQTIANRIIEITPAGFIDRHMTYDEYLEDDRVNELRNEMYGALVK